MLKLLIVDDEVRVCKLIKHLINWEALGINIVGIAHDGKSAFEMILKEPPDIVITDIRMPVWSGLELIEASLDAGLNIHFLITSGYSQFQYALSAIQFGVEDYLLKPLSKKDLEISIQKIIEKHQKQQADKKKQLALEATVNDSSKKIKANYITDLIQDGKNTPKLLDLAFVNEAYFCHFQPQQFQVIIVKPLIRKLDDKQEVKSLLYSKVSSLLKYKTEGDLTELIITEAQNNIYLLANGTSDVLQNLPKVFRIISLEIGTWHELFDKIQVHFILSSIKDDFAQIPMALEEAKEQEFDYLFPDMGNIIPYKQSNLSEEVVHQILDANLRKDFGTALEIMDSDQLKEHLALCQKRIREQKGMNGRILHTIFQTLCNCFYFSVMDKHSEISIDIHAFHEKLERSFRNALNLDDVFVQTEDIIFQYLEKVSQNQAGEGKKVIRKAKNYIHQHLGEHITLEQVSEKVGFTPSYFSTLFKKETEKNFLEYLTELRIENAKELLKSSDLSLVEIAEQVGYHDAKYFSKLFKKIVGLSPREFKKLYK